MCLLPSANYKMQLLLSRRGRHAPKCEATKCAQMQRKRPCGMNHRVRGVNDLSRRGAMDQGRLRRFRSQLASRAGGSRETSRQTIDRDTRPPHPNVVKWTTLCTYTNSWVRPMRRRGRGGGGGGEEGLVV